MRNCSAAELAVRATLLWVRIELRAFAFTRHPASPRPHAVNEENAALRKAIARRRRRADRGAREGADGPELTQRSRRAGSSSRPVLGSKTQTAPRRRCAPPALAPPCRPAAETRARSRVRRASRHASAEQADMQARHCRLRQTSGALRRVAASHCLRASCG